jgi:hypothetical protein
MEYFYANGLFCAAPCKQGCQGCAEEDSLQIAKIVMLWRLITATSQAKLVPTPPPPTALLRMRVGVISNMCLFQLSARQLEIHVQYYCILLLSLFGRYHVCLPHSGDLTITRSLQQLANHVRTVSNVKYATSDGACCRRPCPHTRLLHPLAPGMVLLPPPERRHNTRQVPPLQHAVPQ